MGNAKVSDEEILQALEQAKALDFVKRLPSGLDTLLKMNSPEMVFIIFGCLGALVAGSVEPLFAIALSDFISTFSRHPLGLVSILTNLFIIMNYQCICKFKHQNKYAINKMGSE